MRRSALLAAALATAVLAAEPPLDRVELVAMEGPAPESPCEARTGPVAPQSLRVFRDGRCVLERGIDPGVERASVARDGSVASVTWMETPADGPSPLAHVLWIDPWHPGGKFRFDVEPGRAIRWSEPLSRRRGIAVTTSKPPFEEFDFRVIGTDGRTFLRVGEEEASTLAVVTTDSGRFVALDAAYRERAALPQRGIVVLDLERKTRWAHGWRYGDDREPLSWTLLDDGTLEVRTSTGTTERFDSLGGQRR